MLQWVQSSRGDARPYNTLPDTLDADVPREIHLFGNQVVRLPWLRDQIAMEIETRYGTSCTQSDFVSYNREVTAKAIDNMWVRWLAKIESCGFDCKNEDLGTFICAAQRWNLHSYEMRMHIGEACRNQEQPVETFAKESQDYTLYGFTGLDGMDLHYERLVNAAIAAEDWGQIEVEPVTSQQLNRLGEGFEYFCELNEGEEGSDTTFEAMDDYDPDDDSDGWSQAKLDIKTKLRKVQEAAAGGRTIVEMFGGKMEVKRSIVPPRKAEEVK